MSSSFSSARPFDHAVKARWQMPMQKPGAMSARAFCAVRQLAPFICESRFVVKDNFHGSSEKKGEAVAEDTHKPAAAHPQFLGQSAVGVLVLLRGPTVSGRCERRNNYELGEPIGYRLVCPEARLEIDRVQRRSFIRDRTPCVGLPSFRISAPEQQFPRCQAAARSSA
jgi:hypothetical protein